MKVTMQGKASRVFTSRYHHTIRKLGPNRYGVAVDGEPLPTIAIERDPEASKFHPAWSLTITDAGKPASVRKFRSLMHVRHHLDALLFEQPGMVA